MKALFLMATSSLSFDRGLRRHTIVHSVLAEVFKGTFRPGQHLGTQELAERFGVSHTPIREALVTLAGIGVVELVPNRGAVVRSLSSQDVREVCQVRRALECEATRSACGRIPLATLQELARDLKDLADSCEAAAPPQIDRARELDSRLHDTIAQFCGNSLLAREIQRLNLLFRAYRDVAWQFDREHNDFRRLMGEAEEHEAIVDALLVGNSRAAAQAMSRHVRSGMKYWIRAVQHVKTNSPL